MAYRAGVAVLDRMIQNDQDVERSKRDQDTLERRARSADLALLATGELDIVLAQPADELPGLLYTRCAEFAKQRKLDEASQAADHLRDLKPATGTQKFLAASGYGLCAVHLAADDEPLSDEDAARRQAFLDQSLACLQEAVDAGYDDLDELREDDDLVLTRQLAGYPEIEVRLLTAQRSRLDKQLADQPDDLAVRRRAAYAAEQLGLIRQTQQDWPAARTLFQQAVEHATRVVTANQAAGEEPGWNLGTTHSYLARVALAQQNLTQAVADYEAGLKAEPDSLSCIGRLAWLLATCPDESVRDGERAVELATRACELTDWKDANHIDTLAAALAEAGQFDEAVKRQQQALEIPDAFDEEERKRVEARLRLYESGKPYHVPTPLPNNATPVEAI